MSPTTHRRQPVFVAGLGLASTLGASLTEAVAALAAQEKVLPACRELVQGEVRPHMPMAGGRDDGCSWHENARRRILQVMEECGALSCRSAPLFIASSSINIGAMERGEDAGDDSLCFSERIASWLDWQGPVFWISTACTSAINALCSAQAMIEAGTVERAVVLGIELDNRYSAAGFASMQLLAPENARPLSGDRDGLVLGEAVSAILLVSEDDEAQGLALRWRLRGGANIVDGSNPAGAAEGAVVRMADQALSAAGLGPADIDLVKLQAAGSPHNDLVEIQGLRKVFGRMPALCTLKPFLGHTLGASGAAEIALLLACLDQGVWPRYEVTDRDSEIGCEPCISLPHHRLILAVILGFGGGHAAVVLEDTRGGV